MEWFINDLSIRGQFINQDAVRDAIVPILQLRQRRADLRSRILCSRPLAIRPAIGSVTLQQAILQAQDRIFKQLALTWLANAGPFWDDDRKFNPDDYFHHAGEEVTESGLGEASRRLIGGDDAGVFSFLNPPENTFQCSPLEVHHGLPEDPIGAIGVRNFWEVDAIERSALVPPSSWAEMLTSVTNRMNLLTLSDEIESQLKPHPFSRVIAEKVIARLDVLQSLASETMPDGSRSGKATQIYNTYFIGEAPYFTDESANNKRDFKHEMTFRDPGNPNATLFCPWHGKIKASQFRIHFEWPRPTQQKEIKICYIGPKITKH